MKRNTYILILLLAALLLGACGRETGPDFNSATDPTTASAPVPAATAPTVPLTAGNAAANVTLIPATTASEADFQKFLNEEYWYRWVLNCTFEKPEDISAEAFFGSSLLVYDRQDNTGFTNEERAFLHTQWCEKYGSTPWLDAYRIPVKKINEGLAILNITVKDLEIPENWVYYDKTDSFYAYMKQTATYSAADVTVIKVIRNSDGTAKVYWQTRAVYTNTAAGTVTESGDQMVMTLKKHNDSYVILSNAPCRLTPADLNTREEYEVFIKQEYWYWRALGCTFEKPEDISAEYYFYSGLDADDRVSISAEEQAAIDAAYIKKNGTEPYTAATRLPVAEINKALSILDITIEDIKIPGNWIYYDKTDSWYFWKNDSYNVIGWTVTEVIKNADGTVYVYWEIKDMHLNTATGEYWPDGVRMVMTLQENADGILLIQSNVPAQ